MAIVNSFLYVYQRVAVGLTVTTYVAFFTIGVIGVTLTSPKKRLVVWNIGLVWGNDG
jgi:hypothetical protein